MQTLLDSSEQPESCLEVVVMHLRDMYLHHRFCSIHAESKLYCAGNESNDSRIEARL